MYDATDPFCVVPPMSPVQPRYADGLPPVVHIAIGVVMASFGVTEENALARILIRAMQTESSVEEIARLLVTLADRREADRVEALMDANRPPYS
jgi:hypothetical protein